MSWPGWLDLTALRALACPRLPDLAANKSPQCLISFSTQTPSHMLEHSASIWGRSLPGKVRTEALTGKTPLSPGFSLKKFLPPPVPSFVSKWAWALFLSSLSFCFLLALWRSQTSRCQAEKGQRSRSKREITQLHPQVQQNHTTIRQTRSGSGGKGRGRGGGGNGGGGSRSGLKEKT